jgi:hypothetical protein
MRVAVVPAVGDVLEGLVGFDHGEILTTDDRRPTVVRSASPVFLSGPPKRHDEPRIWTRLIAR